MDMDFVEVKRNYDIKVDVNSMRYKLLQNAIKRDKSAISSRSISGLDEQLRRKLGKPMSLERLMRPLKSMKKIISPVRMNSGESRKQLLELSGKNFLTPSHCKVITPSKTSDLLGSVLKNSNRNEKTPQIETPSNRKDHEKEFKTIKNIKKEESKKPRPVFNKKIDIPNETTNQIPLFSSRNLRRVQESEKGLEKIISKFNIRVVNDIKPTVTDVNIYSALLVILGIIDKKHPLKNNQVLETMEKFLSNPGIVVKSIKSIPFLLKEENVDKGKFYIESIGVSYFYLKASKDYSSTPQIELIRSLLIEIYSLFSLNLNELPKDKREETFIKIFDAKPQTNKENIKTSQGNKKNYNIKQDKDIDNFKFLTTSTLQENNAQNVEDSTLALKLPVKTTPKSSESLENAFIAAIKFPEHAATASLDIENCYKNEPSPKNDVSMDYSYHKDCKNILLEKFFRKNGKELRKSQGDMDFSDNTDFSDGEYLGFGYKN
ncbi:hypothetical protein SteCoe_8421 [Stentor coeruleus]|uniref:Uncharacterized protein n=1 Tax=Stentor coeruleus TaxID=5963 RepID=A0A1R2CK61_9CILI|nr:hypothetical protein SteCoe_8421 [Stentor coeruleus]